MKGMYDKYLKPALSVFVVIGVSAVLTGFCLAGENKGFEIQAVISNMKNVSAYLNSESYIQLLYLPDNGSISFETDKMGRTVFGSDLPRSKFSPDGKFRLKMDQLKHGRYIIVGQKMEPYGLGSAAKPILSYMNTRKVIVIQYPKDTKDRKVLNFGDVLMPVPVQ